MLILTMDENNLRQRRNSRPIGAGRGHFSKGDNILIHGITIQHFMYRSHFHYYSYYMHTFVSALFCRIARPAHEGGKLAMFSQQLDALIVAIPP